MFSIICAAGHGVRLKQKKPKALIRVNNIPLFILAIQALLPVTAKGFLISVPPKYEKQFQKDIQQFLPLKTQRLIWALIEGGKERQDSIAKALHFLEGKLSPQTPILVHNAANIFPDLKALKAIVKVIKKGREGAALAFKAQDTLREVNAKNQPLKIVPREKIWQMQTPQGATFEILQSAYQKAAKDKFLATDDLELIKRAGFPTQLVECQRTNFKITHPEDLKIAAALQKVK